MRITLSGSGDETMSKTSCSLEEIYVRNQSGVESKEHAREDGRLSICQENKRGTRRERGGNEKGTRAEKERNRND